MFRRSLHSAPAALLVAVSTLCARAQEPAEAPAEASEQATPESDTPVLEARESFRLGAELARAGRWDEARIAFKRSGELKSHPVTTFNIAFCNRAVGDLAWALILFQQALDQHAQGSEGRMPDELVEQARQYLAEVAARVARVTLVTDPGASLLVDGHPLEAFTFRGQQVFLPGERPETEAQPLAAAKPVVLLSPGTHVFMAKRAGGGNEIEMRTLGAGQLIEVRLEQAPPRPAPEERRADPESKTPPSGGSNTLAWIVGGTGVAGLGVGTAFGLMSLAAYDKAENECSARVGCGSSAMDERDKAETYAWVSNIGFGVGVVGIAASAYLFLSAPSAEQRPRAAGPRLLVSAGPRSSWIGVSVDAEP